MSEESDFNTLSCGCLWSPTAGLDNSHCDKDEDAHQELIKEFLDKQTKAKKN